MSNPSPDRLSPAAQCDAEAPEPREWHDELADVYARMPDHVATTLSERWRNVTPGPGTYFAEVELARIALSMIEQMHDAPRHVKQAAWQAFTAMADALMQASEMSEHARDKVCVADHERRVLRLITTEGASKGGRRRAEKFPERTAVRDSAICAAWKRSDEMRFNSLREREGWVSRQAPADGPPWSRSSIRRVIQRSSLVQTRNGPRA